MSKKSFWQAVKYTLFSISAGIIQAGGFVLLYNVIFSETRYSLSYVVSLAISVLWSLVLNRKYTFQSANNISLAMIEVTCFYLVFTPVSTWLGQMAETAGWNGNLVQVLSMVANMVLEFLYFKFFVFREKKTEQTQNN